MIEVEARERVGEHHASVVERGYAENVSSKNTTINDPIVWIDCEMTGLDLKKDALVEIAVIVTDSELTPVAPGLQLVITTEPDLLANMEPVVVKMHTDSGLIDEIPDGLNLSEATAQVLDYLKALVPDPRKAPLAGNSVATDRAFLERDMPELVNHLHYRIIDVSSIKELARRWYPRAYFNSPKKNGGHRALADIAESIDELRYYRHVLFPGDDGPTSSQAKAAADLITASPTASMVAEPASTTN